MYPSLTALLRGVGSYGDVQTGKTVTQASDVVAALSVLSESRDVTNVQGKF